jgi:hypothetical protein
VRVLHVTPMCVVDAPARLRVRAGVCAGGLRLGLYEPLKGFVGADGGGAHGSHMLLQRILAGSLSGGFAAAVANPLDLIKVRATCGLPPSCLSHHALAIVL